jgi:Raf kinase inhibitor-like YbhB/YbcL family protein
MIVISNRTRHARFKFLHLLAIAAAALAVFATQAPAQKASNDPGTFQLSSSTFSRDSTLPLSTIFNNPVNGVNTCTANGAPGGDKSPELSWTNAPWGTRSYVVVLYDVTAAFTHWGMYNIAGNATGLPDNAGVANSPFGPQIENDFEAGMEYDGPCPPANVPPDAHAYVFTVYALSTTLDLHQSANFPANAETLYHALIAAGREGQILGSASLTGFYSSTP